MKKFIVIFIFIFIGLIKIANGQVTNFQVAIVNPNNCPYSVTGTYTDSVTFATGTVNILSIDTSSNFQDIVYCSVPSSTNSDVFTFCVVPAPPCTCPVSCVTNYPLTPGIVTILLCGTSGLAEASGKFLSVFPNPTEGILKIHFSTFVKGELEIVDAASKCVYRENISGNEVNLSTESFSSGIYYVVFKASTGERIRERIIR
jgi:Secretion system C-terminal sorting domain